MVDHLTRAELVTMLGQQAQAIRTAHGMRKKKIRALVTAVEQCAHMLDVGDMGAAEQESEAVLRAILNFGGVVRAQHVSGTDEKWAYIAGSEEVNSNLNFALRLRDAIRSLGTQSPKEVS